MLLTTRELVRKDVYHGCVLPIPLEKAQLIPSLILVPMNIAEQNMVEEYRNIIPKERLNHDQSHKWGSGTLVNSTSPLDHSSVLSCCYSQALKRFLNKATALRLR